jgi:hypothetical protein
LASPEDRRLSIAPEDWPLLPTTPGFSVQLDENGRVELIEEDCSDERTVGSEEKAAGELKT